MSGAPPDDGPWKDFRRAVPETTGTAGTIYDGTGARLAGPGPERASDILDTMPHRLVIHDKLRTQDFAVLAPNDCIWLLPDTFGAPPEMPMAALRALASFIQQGGNVGLASRDLHTLTLAYGALVQIALWGAPRQQEPANPHGTLYDGTGTRLLGTGPATITLAQLNAHSFTATIGRKEVLARNEMFDQEDRLWLLPEAFDTPPGLPMDLLQDLAERIARGQRIGLAGNSQALGNAVENALKLLYSAPQGSA